MATPARPHAPLTVEEYLRFEEQSDTRHEYVAGEIHAMSGVTVRHNRIAQRIAAALTAASGDGPCQPLFADVMLRVADDAIYYPDVMVTCGDVDDTARVIVDACLVVEVTSPSTREIDRREKLAAYKRCASVQAYLIVEQSEPLVERHWRDASGGWHRDTHTGGLVPVPCPVGATLSVDEIYRGVAFDADAASRPPLRVRETEPA